MDGSTVSKAARRGIPLDTFRPFPFTTAPVPTILRSTMNTQQSQSARTAGLPAPANGRTQSVPNTPPSGTNTPLTTTPGAGPRCTSTPPATLKMRSRGCSFTTPEDEALAKAWARVSEDAIVGSEQKGEVFFKAVNDLFETLKPAYCQSRPIKSITRRLKKILTECLAFSGCVAKVRNARPSGASNNDVLHLATALLNKVEISAVTDDCGPPFKFHAVWLVLKDHPKFELYCNPPKPNTATSATLPTDEESEKEEDKSNEEEFKRPIGRKRAKAAYVKEDVECKKLKVAEASLATQRERNDLMKEYQELMLFSSNVEMTDPLVAEYINMKRRRVLLREKEQYASERAVSRSPSAPSISPSSPR